MKQSSKKVKVSLYGTIKNKLHNTTFKSQEEIKEAYLTSSLQQKTREIYIQIENNNNKNKPEIINLKK